MADPIKTLDAIKIRRYEWKDSGAEAVGYVNEELPPAMHQGFVEKDGRCTDRGLFSACILIMQAQQKRIERLERMIERKH
jgi:hypothetical protein